MKMRMISACAVAAVFTLAAGALLTARKPSAAAPIAPMTSAPVASLNKVPLEGSDVATLLQLQAWKWRLMLPAGTKNITFWTESWQRNAKKPQINGLGAVGLSNSNTQSAKTLMVKLPDEKNDSTVIALDSSVISSSLPPHVLKFPGRGVKGRSTAENEALQKEQDVILAAYTYNGNGIISSDYKSPAFVGRHDRVVYLKMRLTSGSKLMPTWAGNKVVLRSF